MTLLRPSKYLNSFSITPLIRVSKDILDARNTKRGKRSIRKDIQNTIIKRFFKIHLKNMNFFMFYMGTMNNFIEY